MPGSVYKWSLNLATAGCLVLLYLIFSGHRLTELAALANIPGSQWQNIKTVFVSIFLEALPFILLGVLVSSALHLFVPEDAIRRWIPRNRILGVTIACLLGIVLPVCECGMIPIVRRLIRKGMPIPVGIAYVLAAPVINPVTYAATAMAFPSDPRIAVYRLILAFIAAFCAGLVLHWTLKGNPLRPEKGHSHRHEHNHGHGHAHLHTRDRSGAVRGGRFLSVFGHAADEFFEMGKFLLLGALLTALVQTFVSRAELVSLSGGTFGAHVLMMGFAYAISLCSTSDAFVASSFAGVFPKGALLAFLVFGPMIDFKNTLMMLTVFRARFVANLTVLVAVVVLIASLAAGRLIG
ncbi:hypothetical protein J19TS2_35130 [Cohnella xylanilytica]|uniref:permease n=1 Tax=Cohnella xylanilytica TaxID=557555 RepID=UPI001B2DCE12|nr:permease [Cohnella xylanilytica]GIO13958.1 hypothetical protein J19TS2_35130 [Cohnella xylanilytica]